MAGCSWQTSPVEVMPVGLPGSPAAVPRRLGGVRYSPTFPEHDRVANIASARPADFMFIMSLLNELDKCYR